jgi:hypothetical protein
MIPTVGYLSNRKVSAPITGVESLIFLGAGIVSLSVAYRTFNFIARNGRGKGFTVITCELSRLLSTQDTTVVVETGSEYRY